MWQTVKGSYDDNDVQFLLQEVVNPVEKLSTIEREEKIQSGTHYSMMLPIESEPTAQYMEIYHTLLRENADKMALYTGVLAEQIWRKHQNKEWVIVSLARAGTPIGILVKRYIQFAYQADVPHYTISILRGRGIDEVALDYIAQQHPGKSIQFVDGWTGKGAISKELIQACRQYNKRTDHHISADLAVLADPGYCAAIFGTRQDLVIPSACLNSTVSGLVSRTLLNEKLMDTTGFHGAKTYEHLKHMDESQEFITAIVQFFPVQQKQVEKQLEIVLRENHELSWLGAKDVAILQQQYGISKSEFVKPGVGETTRVLLRRVPWKIVVNRQATIDLSHIYHLAQEKNIPIEYNDDMIYSCCGLIKDVTT